MLTFTFCMQASEFLIRSVEFKLYWPDRSVTRLHGKTIKFKLCYVHTCQTIVIESTSTLLPATVKTNFNFLKSILCDQINSQMVYNDVKGLFQIHFQIF